MATLATSSFSLPKHLRPGVWRKAQGASVLARIAASEPQLFGEQQYMTLTAAPKGEVVGEGVSKSQSQPAFAPVTAIPRKVQVTQRFNEEVQWADEDYQLGVLQTMADLSGEALGRALDLIAIHGINPLTGALLSGSPAKILDSANVVEVTTATLDTPDQDIESAVALVLDDNLTPNGLALDSRFAFSLSTMRDADGRKIYPDIGFGQDLSNFSGLRAAVSDTVRGVEATVEDGAYESSNPNVKVIVGDFGAFKWGVQRNIGMQMIQFGDPDGQGDLKRNNQIALRSEVVYGIGILSTDAFAVIKDASANT